MMESSGESRTERALLTGLVPVGDSAALDGDIGGRVASTTGSPGIHLFQWLVWP